MRTLLANAFRNARRRRVMLAEQTLNAGASLELTQFCPSFADLQALGDAPFFDLVVQLNPNLVNSGLVGAAVIDAGAGITEVLYPFTDEEETNCIRVRGLFPRVGAGAAAVLRTPLLDAASGTGFLENEAWIMNNQAAGAEIVRVGFELPDLGWTGGRDGMGENYALEYALAPRARMRAAQGLSVDEAGGGAPVLDITQQLPHEGEIGDAPFFDLVVTYDVQDVQLGPRVGNDVLANQDTSHALYDRNNVGAGRATVRVRGLLPRQNAAATTLIDGTTVFIANDDAVNAYGDIAIVSEVPSLDWP